MTRAREQIIDPSVTSYYHCINRCVRRAYLCGEDELTGRSFDHRKQWVVDKLKELSSIFAIDICAYAVMSNHYHVVLHINSVQAAAWTDKQVAQRWMQLFKGNLLVARWLQNDSLSEAECSAVSKVLDEWRGRLLDISWFMRCLNESIARMANEEDGCKGRFWESRFKSQALLDEAAILSCMMYVDLNPVRAAVTDTLHDSDFTSIQQRLGEFADRKPGRPEVNSKGKNTQLQGPKLLAFQKQSYADKSKTEQCNSNHSPVVIPFAFDDYLALIDWTGRAIRDDKRGYIPDHIQPLLQQLGIKSDHWLDTVKYFESHFPLMMGHIDRLKSTIKKFNDCYPEHYPSKHWCHGFGFSKKCYQ
ncbi:MAG: alpha-amylase family glycosyl hydrolase [Pseudomonadota bacterium]